MQLLADDMAESLKSPRQLQRSLRDDNIYKLLRLSPLRETYIADQIYKYKSRIEYRGSSI